MLTMKLLTNTAFQTRAVCPYMTCLPDTARPQGSKKWRSMRKNSENNKIIYKQTTQHQQQQQQNTKKYTLLYSLKLPCAGIYKKYYPHTSHAAMHQGHNINVCPVVNSKQCKCKKMHHKSCRHTQITESAWWNTYIHLAHSWDPVLDNCQVRTVRSSETVQAIVPLASNTMEKMTPWKRRTREDRKADEWEETIATTYRYKQWLG